MKSYSDEAIVLRKKPLKEKDELVVVLSKYHGKLALMSYGSRDPKSRKAGVVEQFNTIVFEARQGKGKLPVLQQAKLVMARAFQMLEGEQGLQAFYRASEMVKITDDYVHEEQNVQNVYILLGLALDAAETQGVESLLLVSLLNALGFLPEWHQCFLCDEKLSLDEGIRFCAEHRGFAHQHCCQTSDDRLHGVLDAVDSDVVKLMRYWQQQDFRHALQVQVQPAMLKDIRGLLESLQVE